MQSFTNIYSFIGLAILALGAILLMQSCASKKKTYLNDNTQMEILILAELKKDTKANAIESDLADYKFGQSKKTSKTFNEVLFKVTLRGQSGDILLNKFKNHPLVVNAIIAPVGKNGASNSSSGKVTKTTPIKG